MNNYTQDHGHDSTPGSSNYNTTPKAPESNDNITSTLIWESSEVLRQDLEELRKQLYMARGQLVIASHELLTFQQRLGAYMQQPASVSQAYNVARAIMNWEFGLEDLVATSKRLLDEAAILNIEMSILQSGNDALQRENNKEKKNVQH